MKILLPALLLFIFAHITGAADLKIVQPKPSSEVTALNQAILKELDEIKISEISFRDKPAKDVYAWIQDTITNSDKDHGNYIKLEFDFDLVTFKASENAKNLLDTLVTFELKNVSLRYVLDYINGLAGLRARIEDGKIYIGFISTPTK